MPAQQYTIHISPVSLAGPGLKVSHRYALMVDYRGGTRHTIGTGISIAEVENSGGPIARWAPNPDFSTTPNYTPIRVSLEDGKVGKELNIVVLEGGPRGATGVKPEVVGEFIINVGDYCDIANLGSVHKIITITCSLEGFKSTVLLQLAVHPTGRQIPPLEDPSRSEQSNVPEGKMILNPTAAAFLVSKGLFPASFAGKDIVVDSDVGQEILGLLPPSKGGARPPGAQGSSSSGDSGPISVVFDLNDPAKKDKVGHLVTTLARDAKAAETELNHARLDRTYSYGSCDTPQSIIQHRNGNDRNAAILDRIAKLEAEEQMVKNRMVQLESEQHIRDVTIDACAALERVGKVQEDIMKLKRQVTSGPGGNVVAQDLARDIVAAQREIAILEWQAKARSILLHLLSGGGDLSPDWALLVSEPQPRLEAPNDLPSLIPVSTPPLAQAAAKGTAAALQNTNNTTRPPPTNPNFPSAPTNHRPSPSASDPLDDFFGPASTPTSTQATTPASQGQPNVIRQATTDLFADWEVVNNNGPVPTTQPSAPVAPPEPPAPKEPSTLDDARPVRCEFEGSLSNPTTVMDFDGQQTLHIFEGVVTNLEGQRTTSPGLVLRFVSPQRPGAKAGSVSSALRSLSWYLEVDDIFSSDRIAVASSVTHITHGRIQQLSLLLNKDELNGGAVKSLFNLSNSKSGGEEESVLLLQPMEGNRLRGTTYNLVVTATLNVGTPATRRVALKF